MIIFKKQNLASFLKSIGVELTRDEIFSPSILEKAAKQLGKKESELLKLASRYIGINLSFNLKPPQDNLIKLSGYSIKELKIMAAIPQEDQNPHKLSYKLIVANPDLFKKSEFDRAGISIELSSRSAIKKAWKQADCKNGFKILKKLILELEECGISEVHFKASNLEHYSFYLKEKEYKGRINPLVFYSLASHHNVQNIYAKGSLFSWKIKRHGKNYKLYKLMNKRAYESKKRVYEKKDFWIIDDDKRFTDALERIFKRKNWNVCSFNKAHSALQRLKKREKPNVIVSDIHMPEINGIELLSAIREIHDDLPVLMLSADEDASMEATIANKGANVFLSKNKAPEVLLAWCNQLAHLPNHQ